MLKVLVVYDSLYGNTEKLAKALTAGLESGKASVRVAKVDSFTLDELGEVDLLCVGSPTHGWNASKPTKKFLECLKSVKCLNGKKAFAFDTKLKSRLSGNAGGKIEKKLKDVGFVIVRSSESYIVKSTKGPLEERAEETLKQIGAELAKIV